MKLLPIFAGLGSIATTPLAMKLTNNQINLLVGKDSRIISGGERQERKEPEPVVDSNKEAMKKAAKMLGDKKEGEKIGCFWMPKLSSIEFFFCFNMNQLKPLSLFHFDKGGGISWEDKLNRIDDITLAREMIFSKGEKRSINLRLKAQLAWMHKWKTTFKPSEHCQISSPETDIKNYSLTCNASKVIGAEIKDPWKQTVAKKDVHIPEFQDEIKN